MKTSMLKRAHLVTQRRRLRRPMQMTVSISSGMRTPRNCSQRCGSQLKSFTCGEIRCGEDGGFAGSQEGSQEPFGR